MWQPIDTIPNGDYSAEIDIWDGIRRYTDCFYENGLGGTASMRLGMVMFKLLSGHLNSGCMFLSHQLNKEKLWG